MLNPLQKFQGQIKIQKQSNISLTNWPSQPLLLTTVRLSPKTEKTLKLTKIKYQHILPITFQQFKYQKSQQNSKHNKPDSTNLFQIPSLTNIKQNIDIWQLYEQDKHRRKQKVNILAAIYNKHSPRVTKHNKKNIDNRNSCYSMHNQHKFRYSGSTSRILKTHRSFNSIDVKHHDYNHNRVTENNNNKKIKKVNNQLQLQSAVKNKKKYIRYSDYYDNARAYRKKQKTSHDDESTRSRRLTNQYQIQTQPQFHRHAHNQYKNSNKSQCKNRNTSNKSNINNHNKQVIYSSRQLVQGKKPGSNKSNISACKKQGKNQTADRLLNDLSRLMEKWTQIDQNQSVQLNTLLYNKNNGDVDYQYFITDKQKQRLMKIHQIEKQEIKHELHKIKMQLASHHTHNNNSNNNKHIL